MTTASQYGSISAMALGNEAYMPAIGLASGLGLTPLLPAAQTWIMPLAREPSAMACRRSAKTGWDK
ncbi:hypothetical protein D3C71_1305190 [compost metagenome]